MSGHSSTPPRLGGGLRGFPPPERGPGPPRAGLDLLPVGVARPQCAIWHFRLTCFTFDHLHHE